MNAQPITAAKIFALTLCLCVSCAFASPLPQTKKRSQSDDIAFRHNNRLRVAVRVVELYEAEI